MGRPAPSRLSHPCTTGMDIGDSPRGCTPCWQENKAGGDVVAAASSPGMQTTAPAGSPGAGLVAQASSCGDRHPHWGQEGLGLPEQ